MRTNLQPKHAALLALSALRDRCDMIAAQIETVPGDDWTAPLSVSNERQAAVERIPGGLFVALWDTHADEPELPLQPEPMDAFGLAMGMLRAIADDAAEGLALALATA